MLERSVRTLHMLEKDKKTPEDRIIILSHEIANVAYELLQCRMFPGEKQARVANVRLELGDALTQLNMLCLDLELVPEEILKLGIQHTYERFQEFAERGWDKRP